MENGVRVRGQVAQDILEINRVARGRGSTAMTWYILVYYIESTISVAYTRQLVQPSMPTWLRKRNEY